MQVLIGELGELGRRAVACKHWRWMPGMMDLHGNRFLFSDGSGCWWISDGDIEAVIDEASDSDTPNLSDPATLGCLLNLVREAHTNELISTFNRAMMINDWCVVGEDHHGVHIYAENQVSEIEALVAALEAV